MRKKSSKAISAGSRRMTAAEQSRLSYILSQINEDGKMRTTQQSIPYIAMFPDGICQLTNTAYSKSIQYEDINYELVDTDSKNAIFDKWCALINYFDSTLSVQFSYIHQKRHEAFDESIFPISQKEDSFNSVRNKEKTGKHDKNHTESRSTGTGMIFQGKEKRQSDENCRPE